MARNRQERNRLRDPDDHQVSIRDLVYEVRADVRELTRDMQKRMTRVEIGGAAMTAFCVWALTGRPGMAIAPAAIGVWRGLSTLFTHLFF